MLNLGDTGLIVQYIQNFLKENYNKNIHLSDVYDKDTHKALINYLLLPEIMDCYSFKDLLIKTYTFKEINPPNKLIDGGGIWNFDFDITPTEIRFFNRPISQCLSGALRFITGYINELSDFCREHGWYIQYYSTFVYNEDSNADTKAEIIIRKESRKQLLPCKDIINMINFATNDYLLNKCFLDENNAYHGFIQDSNLYKIALIEAKPGDTFTISHGYKYACEMAIGYTSYTLSEIKQNGCTVDGIVSHLSKSVFGELNSGEYEIYSIPKDVECTYLLIQMPFKNTLFDNLIKETTIKLGDINQDGEITFNKNNENSDYMLLNRYVTALKDGKEPPFVLSGPNLVAANLNRDLDINGNHIVNELDLQIFENALYDHLNTGAPLDFGEVTYKNKIDLSESDYDKLLVIYGNIEENNVNNELNIPISEFQDNPWAVHEEFLPYILGSAIHKYSDIEDILWVQNKAREINSVYSGLRSGYYDSPEDFILNESLIWNDTKTQYEYYKNGVYTGYILDNTIDVTNGKLRREKDMSLSPVEIISGRWLFNGEWTGSIVLSDGRITKEISRNSLKEIIKAFQKSCNNYYKYQNSELIKFITGYVTPLTEKWLNQL